MELVGALFSVAGLAFALWLGPALAVPAGIYWILDVRKHGLRLQTLHAVACGSLAFLAIANLSPVLMGVTTAFCALVAFAAAPNELLEERSLRKAVVILFGAGIVLPATAAVFLAPPRALALLCQEYFPRVPVGLLVEAADPRWPRIDWWDRWSGALALVAIALVLYRERRWLYLQRRQLENLPTSKPSSVALGLAEVAGIARARDDDGERGAIVFSNGDRKTFYLEDDRGRLLVDPADVEESGSVAQALGLDVSHVFLSRGAVYAGDAVRVVGTIATREGAPADATGPDALVLSRRPRDPKRGRLRALVDEIIEPLLGASTRDGDYLDVFLVSDQPESVVLRNMARTRWRVAAVGLTALALCSWMFVSRQLRLSPPELVPPGAVYSRPDLPEEVYDVVLYWDHPHPSYRAYAAAQFEALRPRDVDPALALELIQSGNAAGREVGAWRLTQDDVTIGQEHRANFRAAWKAYEESHRRTRELTVHSLPALGVDAVTAVDVLAQAIDDRDEDVQATAFDVLATYAPEGRAPLRTVLRTAQPGADRLRLGLFC